METVTNDRPIDVLTVYDVQKLLHLGFSAVTALARAGRLRYFTPDHGKHKYLFTRTAIEAYIRERENETCGPVEAQLHIAQRMR